MKKGNSKKRAKKRDGFDLNRITTAIDNHFYRLVEQKPVRCTLAEYAQVMQDETQRVLAQDQIGDLHISTIFTGIDRNFGRGAPVLFETVVFGLPDELHPQWHHSSWDEAMDHHRQLAASISEHGQQYLLDEIGRIAGQAG